MPVTHIAPAGLPEVPLYRQVSVATGSRTVHTAGQVAVDAAGEVVGVGDLGAQVEQCYLNVGTALAAAGATLDDVVKLTAYFVGEATPELMEALSGGIARACATLGVEPPRAPFTGLVVAALAGPDFLVEVEAVAVLD